MSPVKLGDELEVRRPPSEVFEFVADPEHLPAWMWGVRRTARTTPGPVGAGTAYRVTGRVLGRRLVATYSVTAYEDGASFSGRLESPLFRLDETYRVEDEENGRCRLVSTGSTEAFGRLRWLGPLWGVAMRRKIAADHRHLKSVMERRERPSKPAVAPDVEPVEEAAPREA